MRKFASTIVAVLFFLAAFLFASTVLAAPTIRIFGVGRPSPHQMRKHHYRFNGQRFVRYEPVSFKNKSR